MSTGPTEQRNAYKGRPPRPWLRLHFAAPDGSEQELDLVADTGNPSAVIISPARMNQLKYADAPSLSTNFGPLTGGWVQLSMPEFGLVQGVLAYASDPVVRAAKASSPDFEGLLGLPLLRLVEYGGDANGFWIRTPSGTP